MSRGNDAWNAVCFQQILTDESEHKEWAEQIVSDIGKLLIRHRGPIEEQVKEWDAEQKAMIAAGQQPSLLFGERENGATPTLPEDCARIAAFYNFRTRTHKIGPVEFHYFKRGDARHREVSADLEAGKTGAHQCVLLVTLPSRQQRFIECEKQDVEQALHRVKADLEAQAKSGKKKESGRFGFKPS